jgi:hypothetical protein
VKSIQTTIKLLIFPEQLFKHCLGIKDGQQLVLDQAQEDLLRQVFLRLGQANDLILYCLVQNASEFYSVTYKNRLKYQIKYLVASEQAGDHLTVEDLYRALDADHRTAPVATLVSHHRADATAAQAAGLSFIFFDSHSETLETATDMAVIKDLSPLPEILGL